jgi:hypothetical protein
MKHYILFFLIAIFFISCRRVPDRIVEENIEKRMSHDTLFNLSCPNLTRDNKDRLVMSWVKEVNDSVAYLCYAVSPDNGNTFSEAIEILSSKDVHPHGENMPKILFKPDGEIIAMWGVSNPGPKNKYSGLIYYSQSFNEGKTWTEAIPLVKDTSAYDQRYFDMGILPNGQAMVIWLDNRGEKDKEGSSLFCAVSDSKDGFKNEKQIGETCCQCCRTDLFVDSKGKIHAAYRDIINDTIRDMVHIISEDGGKSFTSPIRISPDNWVISGCPHTGPTLAENKNGLHFAWYTLGSGEGVFYANSPDNGKTFSKKDTVCGNASASHPQIKSLPDGRLAIAWDESAKNNDKVTQIISLQLRDENGKKEIIETVSNAGKVCEFPVISISDENRLIIAYTQRENDRKTVVYQLRSINNKKN